jgi:hypothetical protein
LRQPATIKSKLIGLDFVLQHPHYHYLATEREKLDFFTLQLGLDRAVLPVIRYSGRGQVTERFFVEKFPLFFAPSNSPASPPVVSFCFVDEGGATLSAFLTFLRRYSLLLMKVREFQLIYVAANDAHFEAAESAFERFSEQLFGTENGLTGDPVFHRLLEHFEARRLFEAQQWAGFDRTKLIRYRNDRQEFSGEKFEAVYRQWKAAGAEAVRAVLNGQNAATSPSRWAFLTCELKENYDLFGNSTTY